MAFDENRHSLFSFSFFFLSTSAAWRSSLGPGIESVPQLWSAETFNSLHQARDQTLASAVTPAAAVEFLIHFTTARTLPLYAFIGRGPQFLRYSQRVFAPTET